MLIRPDNGFQVNSLRRPRHIELTDVMAAPVITEDTPFSPEDDTYHRASDDPYWFETNWWSLNVPERRIGAWLHAGYSTNRGTVSWRVFVWDDPGADPRPPAYHRNPPDVPLPARADPPPPPPPPPRPAAPPPRPPPPPGGATGGTFLPPPWAAGASAGGAGGTFRGESAPRGGPPPQRFTPGQAPAMHNPHLDQLGHIT